MKNRVRRIANFFAFNLLFFALYLNFIHQENDSVPEEKLVVEPTTTSPAALHVTHQVTPPAN